MRTAGSAALGVILVVVATSLTVPGCVQKYDISGLYQSPVVIVDTSYVLLDPPFGSFVGPRGLLIGNDQLLYVADSAGDRVVMLNRAGQILSERTILHPLSLAQDSRLDLLVGGEVIAPNGDRAGAVFRIHLVSVNPDSAHRLDVARIDTLWRELAHPLRRFPGITTFGDNTYLVVRNGPDNSSFIDPDGRVMIFDSHDVFVTPMPALTTGTGTGVTDINVPTGIASIPGSRDYVLTQSSDGVAYGAIWMRYEKSADVDGWTPKFDPAVNQGVDFIRPYRYIYSRAVAIDPNRKDVFVADAALDSVFKFNSRGQLKSETFGRIQSGNAMLSPVGLAFFENILYVVDGTRGTILRFRLTTDIPR